MQAFGDSFDLYAAMNDLAAGYWDSLLVGANTLVAGRFTGSQALRHSSATGLLTKSSGQNDAVHHVVCAFRQTAALSGTSTGLSFVFTDGATNQCSIVFRSDGAVLLTSGLPTGSVLATYTGAVTAANTWYGFEFEVTIHNTAGSFKARKNGNTSDDFSAGSLNTRNSANNYANKIQVGEWVTVSTQDLDDFIWRSDASSVPFVGDIRGYARMPVSDVSTQFSKAPPTVTASTGTFTTIAISTSVARYTQFTAAYDGTIATATLSLATGYTGNMKCSIFASSGSGPTTVLGSATTINNPVTGTNTYTFPTPVAVVKGGQYYIGFCTDTSAGNWNVTNASASIGVTTATTYAAFPAANQSPSNSSIPATSVLITVTTNNSLVNETQQDGTTSYVYDATVNDADLYAIASIGGVPSNVVAVTTRGFFSKSDAGARGAQVQLKSGATTAGSTPTLLSNTFGWLYRTDVTDPATGSAWTGAAVDALQIGPKVTS